MMAIILKLACPCCGYSLLTDSLTEIYGYCCLNAKCEIGNTLPDKNWCDVSSNEFHREDGPALEFANGDKHWFFNGHLHREDGPAIEYADGTKEYWFHGYQHREDGPALEFANGDKHWYLNGHLHRQDGPAVEYADGKKEYWIQGEQIE